MLKLALSSDGAMQRQCYSLSRTPTNVPVLLVASTTNYQSGTTDRGDDSAIQIFVVVLCHLRHSFQAVLGHRSRLWLHFKVLAATPQAVVSKTGLFLCFSGKYAASSLLDGNDLARILWRRSLRETERAVALNIHHDRGGASAVSVDTSSGRE